METETPLGAIQVGYVGSEPWAPCDEIEVEVADEIERRGLASRDNNDLTVATSLGHAAALLYLETREDGGR